MTRLFDRLSGLDSGLYSETNFDSPLKLFCVEYCIRFEFACPTW